MRFQTNACMLPIHAILYVHAYIGFVSLSMDELRIPILYKGVYLEFSAQVLHFGYSYKIQVDVNDVLVLFEPDENKEFRAVLADPEADLAKSVDKELIETIVETLDLLLAR